MSNTHTATGAGPDHPMQPACPAFTRWMKRRIARTAARHSAAPSAIKPSITTPNTCQQRHSTVTPTHGPTSAHPPTVTLHLPPNAEELHVAALQDLRQRLRCQDAFLQHVMTALLNETVATHTWLTPLPRTCRSSPPGTTSVGLWASGVGRLNSVSDAGSTPDQAAEPVQALPWVRPFDDVWAVAMLAVRDPNLARHEIELTFVVTLVQSLLTPTAFGSDLTHEDLNLLQHIKAARRACSEDGAPDDCVSEFETKRRSNASNMEAQAVLLKALLIPEITDVDAENIHLLQLNRIRRTVSRAMQALQQTWAPVEDSHSPTRSCQTTRSSVFPCAVQPTLHGKQRPPMCGGAR